MAETVKEVLIYTDGACSQRKGTGWGNGGWSAILIFGEKKAEISGGEANTSNNRMEMLAAIKGLEALKEPCSVTLVSDSAYLVNANEQGWLAKWQRNGWKKADNGDVLNKDLWERIIELKKIHKVTFKHTKGHANDELNNRCDVLATEAARKVGQ
jgi:ribonuclease HI